MGSTFAHDIANNGLGLSLERSIALHLTANHYPPVPVSMVQPCIEAIDACNEDEPNRLIYLNGASWRGQSEAPAWAIVEGHHLDAWIEWGE
jgi:hypothetical protein